MSGIFSSLSNYWPFKLASRRPPMNESRSEIYTRALRPWETNMFNLQSILIWEKPRKSAITIAIFNFLYWWLAMSDVRVFFLIGSTALVLFLHNQWVYSIWPEIRVPQAHTDQEDWTPIHPRVLSAPELGCYLQKTSLYLEERRKQLLLLRRRNHGMFCILLCGIFGSLWLLGFYMKGVVLLYILLMTLACGPGIAMYLIPPFVYSWLGRIKTVLFREKKSMSDSCDSIECDIAEFLPEVKDEEIENALDLPLAVNDPTDDTILEEEIMPLKPQRHRGKLSFSQDLERTPENSQFTAGLNEEELPSLGDDSYEEEAYIGLPDIPEVTRATPSSESDIRFVHSHFASSEDEDEEFFAMGLNFKEGKAHQAANTQAHQSEAAPSPIDNLVSTVVSQNAAEILSTVGQNLVISMMGAKSEAGPQPGPEEVLSQSFSSIDSDFEVVSDIDLH